MAEVSVAPSNPRIVSYRLEFEEMVIEQSTKIFARLISPDNTFSHSYEVDESYKTLREIQTHSSSSIEYIHSLIQRSYFPVVENGKIFFKQEKANARQTHDGHDSILQERYPTASSTINNASSSTSSGVSFPDLFQNAVDQLSQRGQSLKLYAVLKLFEEALNSIKGGAEALKIKRFSCFICFDFDDEHQKNLLEWVGGPLIQDLDRAGLIVWSTRNLTYGESFSYFQARIFHADKVVLICTRGGANKIRSRMEEEGGIWRGIAAEMLMLLNSLENGRKGQSVIPIYEKGFPRKDTCLFPLFLGSKGIKDLVPSITSERLSRLRQEAEDFDSPKQVFNVEHREKIPIGNALYYSTALKLYGTIRGLPPELFNEIQQNFLDKATELLLRDTDFSDNEMKELDDWKQRKEEAYLNQLQRNVRGIKHPELALADQLVNFYRSQQEAIYNVDEEGVWGIDIPIEGVDTDLMIVGKIEINRNDKTEEVSENKQGSTHKILFGSKDKYPPERLFDQMIQSQKKRAVVFGVPGSGKTMFCRKAAIDHFQLWPEFKVVFLIKLRNLRHYSNGENVYQVLSGECGFALADYEDLLVDPNFRQNTLLILDGYDELPSGKKHTQSQKLFSEFEKNFPHIIVTSRPGIVHLCEAVEFEIFGFNENSIATYVKKFYEGPLDANVESRLHNPEQYINPLLELLNYRSILKSLVQIPINLALVCTLFKEDERLFRRYQEFTVTTFYVEIVNWFFRRYLTRLVEQGRCKESISDIHEQQNLRYHKKIAPIARALERIAFQGIDENTPYINQSDIERVLGEEGVYFGDLKKLGILRIKQGDQRRGGEREFIHFTFQEYFSAAYLAHLYLDGRTIRERGRLNDEGKKIISRVKFQPRYQFLLNLTAGILSDDQNEIALQVFFDHLFSKPRDLAKSYEFRLIARCLEECKDPSELNQYDGFIRDCVSYIGTMPSPWIAFELLNKNNKLLNDNLIRNVLYEAVLPDIECDGRDGELHNSLYFTSTMKAVLSDLFKTRNLSRNYIEDWHVNGFKCIEQNIVNNYFSLNVKSNEEENDQNNIQPASKYNDCQEIDVRKIALKELITAEYSVDYILKYINDLNICIIEKYNESELNHLFTDIHEVIDQMPYTQKSLAISSWLISSSFKIIERSCIDCEQSIIFLKFILNKENFDDFFKSNVLVKFSNLNNCVAIDDRFHLLLINIVDDNNQFYEVKIEAIRILCNTGKINEGHIFLLREILGSCAEASVIHNAVGIFKQLISNRNEKIILCVLDQLLNIIQSKSGIYFKNEIIEIIQMFDPSTLINNRMDSRLHINILRACYIGYRSFSISDNIIQINDNQQIISFIISNKIDLRELKDEISRMFEPQTIAASSSYSI